MDLMEASVTNVESPFTTSQSTLSRHAQLSRSDRGEPLGHQPTTKIMYQAEAFHLAFCSFAAFPPYTFQFQQPAASRGCLKGIPSRGSHGSEGNPPQTYHFQPFKSAIGRRFKSRGLARGTVKIPATSRGCLQGIPSRGSHGSEGNPL